MPQNSSVGVYNISHRELSMLEVGKCTFTSGFTELYVKTSSISSDHRARYLYVPEDLTSEHTSNFVAQ